MTMYKIVVFWQNGRQTVVAESHNPSELHGAPMVARNPATIRRVEMHDLTGCLETFWDAGWSV